MTATNGFGDALEVQDHGGDRCTAWSKDCRPGRALKVTSANTSCKRRLVSGGTTTTQCRTGIHDSGIVFKAVSNELGEFVLSESRANSTAARLDSLQEQQSNRIAHVNESLIGDGTSGSDFLLTRQIKRRGKCERHRSAPRSESEASINTQRQDTRLVLGWEDRQRQSFPPTRHPTGHALPAHTR